MLRGDELLLEIKGWIIFESKYQVMSLIFVIFMYEKSI